MIHEKHHGDETLCRDCFEPELDGLRASLSEALALIAQKDEALRELGAWVHAYCFTIVGHDRVAGELFAALSLKMGEGRKP